MTKDTQKFVVYLLLGAGVFGLLYLGNNIVGDIIGQLGGNVGGETGPETLPEVEPEALDVEPGSVVPPDQIHEMDFPTFVEGTAYAEKDSAIVLTIPGGAWPSNTFAIAETLGTGESYWRDVDDNLVKFRPNINGEIWIIVRDTGQIHWWIGIE